MLRWAKGTLNLFSKVPTMWQTLCWRSFSLFNPLSWKSSVQYCGLSCVPPTLFIKWSIISASRGTFWRSRVWIIIIFFYALAFYFTTPIKAFLSSCDSFAYMQALCVQSLFHNPKSAFSPISYLPLLTPFLSTLKSEL